MTKVVLQKMNLTGQTPFTSYMKNPVSFVVPLVIGFASLTSVAFAESPSVPSKVNKAPTSAAAKAKAKAAADKAAAAKAAADKAAADKPESSPAPPRPDSSSSLPVPADKKACFQLEAKAKDITKEPQLLCVEQIGSSYALRLSTGLPGSATEVAVFNFQLQSRARCMDCNMDVFGLSNPSNSVFNKLSIEFNGNRDIVAGTESGTVKIGSTQFYYRAVK